MDPTSVSLLDRLREAPPDASDWGRLRDLYLPLIRRWIGRVPDLEADVDDLAQDVFVVLIREIPRFERRREGSFRAWLRKVAANRVLTYWKQRRRRPAAGPNTAEGFLQHLAEPQSELAREWDLEHDRHVFQKLLAVVQPEFAPGTWEAFRRFAIDGVPAAQVAAESGLSVNAVILAKSRVLKRLRKEAGDLLE